MVIPNIILLESELKGEGHLMLQRQKIILSLLSQSAAELSLTKLVKLAFLLSRDSSFKDSTSFYDFVPYKFGPFSFAMYRELAALERYGYIGRSDESVWIKLKLLSEVRGKIQELKNHIRVAVDNIVKRYSHMKQDELLRYVYKQFSWYAINSTLTDLRPRPLTQRPVAPVAVYTIGYEGMSVDALFDVLLQKGIQAILDVRANPVSRKYGLAKKSLLEISAKLGLTYHHLPEFGINGSQRTELNSYESYQKLLDRYENTMLPKRRVEIGDLVGKLRERPSVLLCYEKDHKCCHRGRLASEVARVGGLKVVHI